MFNWKIVATLFITLGILVVVLASSPQMGGFIDTLKGKVSGIVPDNEVTSDVSFMLVSDATNVTGKAREVNLELTTGNFSAQLKDINVSSKGTVRVLGFSGSISVGKTLSIDGIFKKIELEHTNIFPSQGSIKSESYYEKLIADNLEVKELTVQGGKLTVNNVTTSAESRIILSYPVGRFEFSGDKLVVSGKANKISIPDAKMFVG